MKTAAAITCASVVLLAGCVGDDGDDGSDGRLSKSDYERKVRGLVRELQDGPQIERGEKPQEIAVAFTEVRRRILAFAEDFEALDAPAEVQTAERDLVAGERAAAADMQPVIALLRSGDEEGVDRMLNRPTSFARPRTVELIRRGFAGYEDKGYDLGLTGPPGVSP